MPLSSRDFPRAAAVASRLVVLPHTASTNDALVERVQTDASGWPHLSVVVTDDQRSGRGRLGRVWSAAAGTSLAVSVLLRPRPAFSPDVYGWVPLLAGAALTVAVREALAANVSANTNSNANANSDASASANADANGNAKGNANANSDASGSGTRAGSGAGAENGGAARVELKWPNDVLIDGRKVSGVLSELVTVGGAPAVIVGAGVNLTMSADQLPVPTATSLVIAGAETVDADALLTRFLEELSRLLADLQTAGGDAAASGALAHVSGLLGTLGRTVRVEVPGAAALEGRAVALATDGRLIVRPTRVEPGSPGEIAVAAGDITHLRFTDDSSGNA